MESTSTTLKKTWYEKYETSMKMFLPFRWGKDRNNEALKDEKIGCFSYVSLHWMNGHMWRASRTQLNVDHLKDIRKRNGVQTNTQKLKTMWSEEIKNKGPANASLFRTICKFNMWRLIIAAIFITSMAICNYVGPTWVLYKMLQCLNDPHIPISQGVIWAIVFSLTQIVRHLMFNAFWVTSAYAGIKITAALQGLIYDQIFTAKTNGDIDMAEVVSFFTSDLERIYQLLQSMILLVPPPFITVTHIVYTYTLLGPWTLLGNAVMLLYAPFMIFVTKMAGKYRSNAVKMADKRIGMMNQLLNNVKFIKMMTWENDFFEIVKEARDGESKSLKKAIFLQSISWSTVVIAGNLALALSTIGYLLTGGILGTIPILNLMSAYAAMATPLGTVVLSVKAISEGLISCRRLQKFLTPADDDDPVTTAAPNNSHHSIVITNMSVGWCNDKTQTPIKKINNNNPKTINHADQCKGEINLAYESTEDLNERQSVLTCINLCIPRGQLVGICGNVGSGKSTLLSSICGSTTILNGDIKVNGSIALVTQQAWIFSGTVQKNIIFGLPLDSEWYEQVIDVCCLRTDFKLMANGDQTEIGERGANLSGGQKQRINLARAVYSNRNIYLLDDPLSAVDAKVAKHIFNNCIQGCLSQKTVLLLTHNTQFLSKCEYVVIMQNGTIRDQGTHSTLINNNQEYARMCQQSKENVEDKQVGKNTVQTILSKEDDTEDGKNEEKMIKAEVDNKSTIALRTLLYFCRQCGGYFTSLLLFMSVVLFSATSVFNNVWYKIWLSADDKVVQINVNNSMNETVQLVIDVREPFFYPYFAVYVCSMAGLCIFAIVKGLLIRHSILKGSSRLHMQMFWKVVRSPMSFFDSTPQGRIVNRFSRDMDELDVHIPSIGEYVGQTLFIVTFQAIVVCNLYPWFTIALVIIIVIFIVFDKLFTASVQETKRMDNLLKPPVINHLNTTAQGLEVIKCYNKQQLFVEIFTDLVEQHLSPYLQYQLSSKWFSFRVDIIGWVAITVLALMIMLTKSTTAVLNGGLSLVLIIQACIILSVAMRFKSEFQAKLTSLERICDYCTGLVEEAPAIIEDNRPSDRWPSNGMIEFRDVYLKYRPETPLVLQGLTVTIRACEKVGIIGRTGAGKSSVIASILRLTEVFEGSIIIDDVDISKIGLEDLRSKMAVIPQEPVLFDGTVRWNLDPSNKYSDEEIWDALEKSHLKIKILNEPSGLQTSFNANGGMFSMGEKQLFCLARALLKKSKILLLDEATANVDYETDKLIQESIRSCFSDCTVLTIAHRLNTIIDYDKIMTMEAGKVIEFDTPTNLLERESQFRSMLNAQ